MARVGRPTTFNSETLEKTKDYIEFYKSKYGDEMPSVAGLADVLDVGRQSIYDWEGNGKHKEFSYNLERLLSRQEKVLLNNGLNGSFTSPITKVSLGKHGYTDRTDVTVAERPTVTRKRYDGS